jgi:hypothetical protein
LFHVVTFVALFLVMTLYGWLVFCHRYAWGFEGCVPNTNEKLAFTDVGLVEEKLMYCTWLYPYEVAGYALMVREFCVQ